MSNSFTRGVYTVALLIIGLGTVIYAANEAYAASDQDAAVIENLHPVMETVIWTVPFAIAIVTAVSLVGVAGWLLSQTSTNRGGR